MWTNHTEMSVRQRYNDRIHEGRNEQFARRFQSRTNSAAWHAPAMAWLGRQFVTLGIRLQMRYRTLDYRKV
jgi:hypothetical protein